MNALCKRFEVYLLKRFDQAAPQTCPQCLELVRDVSGDIFVLVHREESRMIITSESFRASHACQKL
jgi:hypothetical protein